jgi:uncharacterized protein (TIGR03067 family)
MPERRSIRPRRHDDDDYDDRPRRRRRDDDEPEGRSAWPVFALAIGGVLVLVAVAVLALSFALQRPPADPEQAPGTVIRTTGGRGPDGLMGAWVVQSGEVKGQKAPAKDAGKMKLEFRPGRVTWHHRVRDGWQSFDGELRHDPTSDPKQIDLAEPTNPKNVARGIYKIEGDRLTISAGAARPRSFQEPGLFVLVFKRQ